MSITRFTLTIGEKNFGMGDYSISLLFDEGLSIWAQDEETAIVGFKPNVDADMSFINNIPITKAEYDAIHNFLKFHLMTRNDPSIDEMDYLPYQELGSIIKKAIQMSGGALVSKLAASERSSEHRSETKDKSAENQEEKIEFKKRF